MPKCRAPYVFGCGVGEPTSHSEAGSVMGLVCEGGQTPTRAFIYVRAKTNLKSRLPLHPDPDETRRDITDPASLWDVGSPTPHPNTHPPTHPHTPTPPVKDTLQTKVVWEKLFI